MFGREARLPVDLCFRASDDESDEKSHYQYVDSLKRDLQRAYQLASQSAEKSHLRNKRAYDQKVSLQNIQEGDRVLLRNLGLRGKHKLESRWGSTPHVVVSKLPNLPVFQVGPEGRKGGARTIHRDHLLPIGQSVRIPKGQSEEEVPKRPKTRSTRTGNRQLKTKPKEQICEVTESSSDVESNRPRRNYRDCINSLLKRQATVEREFESSEEEVVRDFSPERSADESETGRDDPESQVETDESSDSETDLEVSRGPVRATKTKPSSKQKPDRVLRPRSTEKRQVKPVLRLTYDEPGKASEQPITIVHRGIINQLGKK